jgi:hypothetical protein
MSEQEKSLKALREMQYEGHVFFSRVSSFLSQFFISEFQCDGHKFNSAEKFMMYCKASLFKDRDTRLKIVESDDPAHCKKLGRCVTGFDEDKWIKLRVPIVYYGNYLKFINNEKIFKKLLKTKNKLLIEDFERDLIWSVGLTRKSYLIKDHTKWKGQNLMGLTITKFRNDCIDGKVTKNINDIRCLLEQHEIIKNK